MHVYLSFNNIDFTGCRYRAQSHFSEFHACISSKNHSSTAATYRPVLVMIISVPSSWNLSHSSFVSSLHWTPCAHAGSGSVLITGSGEDSASGMPQRPQSLSEEEARESVGESTRGLETPGERQLRWLCAGDGVCRSSLRGW